MQTQTTYITPRPTTDVTVLIVGTRPSDQASLRRILRRSKWRLLVSSSGTEALALLKRNRVPVVICDAESSDSDWRLLLNTLTDLPHPPMLIVSSRLADEHLWAEVLNLGGYDVLTTPFDEGEVLRVAFLAWQFWDREGETKWSVRACS